MLNDIKKIFERENISVEIVPDKKAALAWVLSEIAPGSSVAFAGSETIKQIGAYEYLLSHMDLYELINPYKAGISPAEALERRRLSLLADVLLTGTNAITMNGELVNLDNQGNRVAGISFGPKKVLIVVGKNKIVKNLAEAKRRISNIAAPLNSKRLARGNPCEISGKCESCGLKSRICRIYSIINGQTIEDRIKMAIVDEELGY